MQVSRVLSALLLAAASLAAQPIRGRFIVELSEPPLGALARTRDRLPEKTARRARIVSSQRAAARLVETRGGRVLSTLSTLMNGLVVRAGDGDETWLAALPGVVKVYPVDRIELNLDHALPLHNAPAAWALAGGREQAGAGVKIAILDTGISPEHPGFSDPALVAPNGFPIASSDENKQYTNSKIIVARDYGALYQTAEPDDVRDRHGHGTAVAMCAAGAPNQGPWANIAGVAPKAWIGVYKISSLDAGSSASDIVAKAADDAVADGMDIINLSSGSALVRPLEENPTAVALDRAAAAGVIVVVAAGNNGPARATIGNYASLPSAISVGASENDRVFTAGVEFAGSAPRSAIARAGVLPDDPVSGSLKDIQSIEAGANACAPLPEGSLQGMVALGSATGCTFEIKLRVLENAGAIGAVLYIPTAGLSPLIMSTGQSLLPAVMVGYDDGRALRAAAENPETPAKLWFRGLGVANDPKRLRTSSSRGPTYSYRIKPDLAATGYVYTAAQKLNEKGAEYSAGGYIATSGTSFASPLVAGAAALLKAARPGLTVDQYRSLLINRANPLEVVGVGLEGVQRTGNGTLDLSASLGGTLAAYPTSVSFGIGGATVEKVRELSLTNLGKSEETVKLNVYRFDGAAPPLFSDNPGGVDAAEGYSAKLAPGETRTLYVSWKTDGAAPGEYQGMIGVQGTADGASLLVPYWYGVPSGVPAAVTTVQAAPTQLTIGQTASVYFRVIDAAGIPLVDRDALQYDGAVTGGGGTMSDLQASTSYPNLLYVQIRAGATAGRNTYRVIFGGLPAVTFTVEGRDP